MINLKKDISIFQIIRPVYISIFLLLLSLGMITYQILRVPKEVVAVVGSVNMGVGSSGAACGNGQIPVSDGTKLVCTNPSSVSVGTATTAVNANACSADSQCDFPSGGYVNSAGNIYGIGWIISSGDVRARNGYFYLGGSDYNALQGTDSWLRLNQGSQFTSGTYTPGNFRSDGGYYGNGTVNLRENTSVTGTLTVSGNSNTCQLVQFTGSSGTTNCPAGYYTWSGVGLTTGQLLCCKVSNPI